MQFKGKLEIHQEAFNRAVFLLSERELIFGEATNKTVVSDYMWCSVAQAVKGPSKMLHSQDFSRQKVCLGQQQPLPEDSARFRT